MSLCEGIGKDFGGSRGSARLPGHTGCVAFFASCGVGMFLSPTPPALILPFSIELMHLCPAAGGPATTLAKGGSREECSLGLKREPASELGAV